MRSYLKNLLFPLVMLAALNPLLVHANIVESPMGSMSLGDQGQAVFDQQAPQVLDKDQDDNNATEIKHIKSHLVYNLEQLSFHVKGHNLSSVFPPKFRPLICPGECAGYISCSQDCQNCIDQVLGPGSGNPCCGRRLLDILHNLKEINEEFAPRLPPWLTS